MPDHNQRLTEIEQNLSHQARLAEVLNEVVCQQSREIEAFATLIKRLEARIEQLEGRASGGDSASTADEASPWKDPEM